MTSIRRLNLALRAAMEVGIVAALAVWGMHIGRGAVAKILLGGLAPAVGFGFWGAVDFRRAGALAEPIRLIQELAISGLAALALYVSGLPALGWSLAALSLVHHLLVYVLGERLLKR